MLSVLVTSDYEFVVLAAMRYSLGRQTYAPDLVSRYIQKNWGVLSLSVRECIFNDLKDELARHDRGVVNLGPEDIKNTWCSLYAFARDNLKTKSEEKPNEEPINGC